MQILSHRGHWSPERPKNSVASFRHSFAGGFGTETDFRDSLGQLVISHDPPDREALDAETFFSCFNQFDASLPLAINIKSDGLQSLLRDELVKHDIRNYFLFDMSVPDAITSLRCGLRVFTRQSDVEPDPVLYAESSGVWVDAFRDPEWLTPEIIRGHLEAGKSVCLVSPELHGRDHNSLWEMIDASGLVPCEDLMLCTDFPDDASNYFRNA